MLRKQQKRELRKKRVRARISGTKLVPRLSVFRSAKYIYAQIIDDEKGKVLLSASEKDLKKEKGLKKSERAKALGVFLAKEALEKKIEKIVFDRGGYKYHGRVKALAEGAREGGLKF